MPKFSLLMTIFKTENPAFLNDSFKSIWNEQILKPNQIVIVLDGPIPNKLTNVVTKWKHEIGECMKVFPLKANRGLGDALAYGINFCDHEYIARMDTDDISMPSRFYDQINFLKVNEDIDIIGSNAVEFTEHLDKIRGTRHVPENHKDILEFSKYRNPFNHPSVIYRKSKVLEAGGPKNFTDFDDYYLWIRMFNKGARCANISKPLIYMRANKDQAKRRGGYRYLKNEIKFFNFLLGIKYISHRRFLINMLFRLPIRLMPYSFRYFMYKFLRK